MSVEIERMVYEHALRAADIQERALADLRTRAGTVLAAAALVASFLGTPAVEHHPDSWGLAVAVAALVVLLGSTIYVLLGKEFIFRNSPKKMLEGLDTGVYKDEGDALRKLALYMEINHDKNEEQLGKLNACFALSCSLLIVETIALIAAF